MLVKNNMSLLEKRREGLESRRGGDHDIPFRFTRPCSMPQVNAWMKLLAWVQDGPFKPLLEVWTLLPIFLYQAPGNSS